MTDEEKASLNYYLTKLRCQITKMLIEEGQHMSPNIEIEYEDLITAINMIMKINLIEGEK